jgi:1,4-alpha-glucan branching enzyme
MTSASLVTVPGQVKEYRVDVDGRICDDPYRYLPTMGELDLALMSEGRHERLWMVLGARVVENTGVSFAVWAPNARAYGWSATSPGEGRDGWPMRSMGPAVSGELLVPDAAGRPAVQVPHPRQDGVWREKADPMARYAGCPTTASVIFVSSHQWGDADWMTSRAGRSRAEEPMSVYEVHLGSWRPGLSIESSRRS